MSINIDCYLTFKKEKKDKHVTCGVVLVNDQKEEIFTAFESYEHGLYIRGMFMILVKAMNYLHTNTLGGVNLFIKVHSHNKNFHAIFTKIQKAMKLINGVEDERSIGFIVSQAFISKNHQKPKSYETMIDMVKVLRKVNERQPFVLAVGIDSNSFKAQRTYFETITRHNNYGKQEETTNVVQFPSPEQK